MIVETSALMAILFTGPEREAFRAAILGDPARSRMLDDLVASLGLRFEPVTAEQARTARQAHRDFGRGSGHPAKLNFGDTFGYALAVTTGKPLLFRGDDFSEADVRRALP